MAVDAEPSAGKDLFLLGPRKLPRVWLLSPELG